MPTDRKRLTFVPDEDSGADADAVDTGKMDIHLDHDHMDDDHMEAGGGVARPGAMPTGVLTYLQENSKF